MVANGKVSQTKALTTRQEAFARLVVAGRSQTDAWREAYNHPNSRGNAAHVAASKLAAMPAVQDRIAYLKTMADRKSVLSLDERLAILARDAQIPGTTPAMLNARARVIEVYNKTAGDGAPERVETTVRGDASAPVVVTTVKRTKAEKIAALAAQRPQRPASP